MGDFSEFNFGREEARSKGASGGRVFLVCKFLADQVRFWAFLFRVCIFFGRPGTLGEGNNVEGTGFRCAGGAGVGGAPRRRPALGAPPGRTGFRSLRSRYPWGGGIQGLERPGPRGGPVGFSVNVGAQASLAPPLTEKARRIACARPFKSLSGKRDSDPRPQPWQGCALPTELFPQLGLQI